MNSSTSGLENGCLLAKNFMSFKEAVGARFSSFLWFHSLYFGFTYSIGDALRFRQITRKKVLLPNIELEICLFDDVCIS